VGYEILVGMGLSFFTIRRYKIPNYYYFFAYPIYPQFSNIYKSYSDWNSWPHREPAEVI